MVDRIRLFLALESAIFIVAALIHFEVILDGYPDREAGTAESIIAVVLLAGLSASLLRPAITRERASSARASPWPEPSSA